MPGEVIGLGQILEFLNEIIWVGREKAQAFFDLGEVLQGEGRMDSDDPFSPGDLPRDKPGQGKDFGTGYERR